MSSAHNGCPGLLSRLLLREVQVTVTLSPRAVSSEVMRGECWAQRLDLPRPHGRGCYCIDRSPTRLWAHVCSARRSRVHTSRLHTHGDVLSAFTCILPHPGVTGGLSPCLQLPTHVG